jgi:hypothetical protein
MLRFDRLLSCCLGLATTMLGCGSPGPQQDGTDPDQMPSEAAPDEPGKEDSASAQGYGVQGVRSWYAIGNGITAGQDTLEVAVTAPSTARHVDMWVDQMPGVRLTADGGVFRASADISALGPGPHRLLLASNGKRKAFAKIDFIRSHPMYVFVSTDWDAADNSDASLARQERLHQAHSELKITHFVGPYTFTEPSVPASRAELLVDWVKTMRDRHGDEIGLHIHPYCSFVNASGVTCRTEPSFSEPSGDSTGYTVVVASYTKEEMSQLLASAIAMFAEHGLGRPTGFRAGGWTVQTHTLQALAENGFVADGSPANWSRLEEWKDEPGAALYPWCKQNWSTMSDTSQPYYPSESNILSSSLPVLPILEVPDNGLLVDYVTGEEMIEIFTENWDGQALQTPRLISIGYHPPNFSEAFKQRMDGALTHMDQYLLSQDKGPVVYARMSDLPVVWPMPVR